MNDATPRAQSWPSLTGWALLVLTSVAMFGNYYVYDSIGPVADMLENQRGFTALEISTLNGIYSLPNIVLVLVGGVIIDRLGAARGSALFAAICTVGAVLTAWAPSFAWMAAGRLVFGLGAESMIVGITALFGQWFRHQRLGLMLGLNLSLARAGSYAVDLSPDWAHELYAKGPSGPLWIAAGLAFVSLLGALATLGLRPPAGAEAEVQGRISLRGTLTFGREFWWLVALCVAIYSVLLPFRSTFAIQYFQEAHGLTRAAAGTLNGNVFLAAIFATPVFGWIFDRSGRRAPALFYGSLLLLPVFPLLAWTSSEPWISNVLLGLTYSMVPAVLWPGVAQLVDRGRLGTAYGLMTMIQNVGLTLVNPLAGWLNDHYQAGPANPAGYTPMLVLFLCLSVVSVFAAGMLYLSVRRAAASQL